MSSTRLLATSIVAVIAIAACSGGPTTPTGATTPTSGAATTAAGAPTGAPAATAGAGQPTSPIAGLHLCGLLTAAELKTATGADYGEGVDDGYGQCIWRVGGATVNNGDGQIVAAFVQTPVSGLKGAFAGGVDLTIGGHTAYWNPLEGLATLWIDVPGGALAFSFDPVTDGTQAIAEKVGALALAKL